MDERFLESQRRAPRPEFANALRESLAEAGDDERRGWRAAPWLAAAAGLVAVLGLFAFPAVRASAQAVLDLFRVREFAVVQVDPARLDQLRQRRFDPASLISGKPVTLQDPGPTRLFASIEAAAAATGLSPVRPTLLPRGLVLDSVAVQGESRTRATIDARPLRELMEAFDVRDLPLPDGLDGAAVEMHVPPVVVERYRGSRGARAVFVQCAGPEATLPSGVSLARLGEIGLRLFGLAPDDAHRIAGRIDWRSTLVVPVVGSATSFLQVDVAGAHGLYLESAHTAAPGAPDQGHGSIVLWNRGGRVYAVIGNLDRMSLVQIAESVH
jgi:hypothetical protein